MSRKRYRKTPTMLLIEVKDPEQRDIAQIMLDAYRKTGSEARAAQMMEITQQAFNDWKYRLRLEKQIDEIAFNLKYGVSVTGHEKESTGNDDNSERVFADES